MKDERITKLAENLLNYSVELQKGENIYIEVEGNDSLPLLKELIKQATQIGGIPFYYYNDKSLTKEFITNSTQEQMKHFSQFHKDIMEKVDAYISIRGANNPFDLAGIDKSKMENYNKYYMKQVHQDVRLKKRWVVLRYPNDSMSVMAEQSTEQFEDLFFKVCNLDYSKMSKAMDRLVSLMEKTDIVRIIRDDTDISFSIKGLPAIKCDGKFNIPDGEVFTAPVLDSVNGIITFNTPTVYNGTLFSDIELEFNDGKVIKASSGTNTKKLSTILDTDDGARFVGEFSFGVNPFITKPIKDTLFDEKIAGSIHLALGNAYDICDNGNKSAIHWDIVQIHTAEHGGGKIFFDDVLIRENGLFVPKELAEVLNPDSLK